MKRLLNNLCELLTLFLSFGFLYFLLESIWKGYFTNWRMFVLAGIIGTIIGLLNNVFTYDTDFICQCLIGTQSAVLAEAIFGYHWNVEMGLGLWNYSNPPLSYFSFCSDQINLIFALLWVFLSAIAIVLADIIHCFIFNRVGERPYYKIRGRLIFQFKERR